MKIEVDDELFGWLEDVIQAQRKVHEGYIPTGADPIRFIAQVKFNNRMADKLQKLLDESLHSDAVSAV